MRLNNVEQIIANKYKFAQNERMNSTQMPVNIKPVSSKVAQNTVLTEVLKSKLEEMLKNGTPCGRHFSVYFALGLHGKLYWF